MFSSTEYENYMYRFPPIESALYKGKGNVEEISTDDPRLLRLLNFIAYSYEHTLDVLVQGYILEDEINTNLATRTPMLEVNFSHIDESENSEFNDVMKIVICGDQYLKFVDERFENSVLEGTLAERYWPYGSIAMSSDADNIELSEKWGEDGWIDILEYAGFG